MTQPALGHLGGDEMGRDKREEIVFFFFIIRKVTAQSAFYRLPVILEWSLISVSMGERKNRDNLCGFREGSVRACHSVPSRAGGWTNPPPREWGGWLRRSVTELEELML